jgi:hypothetical protein
MMKKYFIGKEIFHLNEIKIILENEEMNNWNFL